MGRGGGSRADRSGRGYSLSQDSRLSPSASAILQPPGPAQRPQTSRELVRDEPGRGLHGGLRGEPALLGSVRTAADNETPNVSFWLLPFDLGVRDSQRPDECSVAQI